MFKNLLSKSENRRLQLVEILAQENDWIRLSELSKKLSASTRVLKEDLAFFRQTVRDFSIESSNKGIRLFFKKNKGLKTVSRNILMRSVPYQLLELIFFHENKSVTEVAQNLFMSSSTLYRVINKINKQFAEYNIEIETQPCRIVGDERAIRYFFYLYFFERYSRNEWPFECINEEVLDELLIFFIKTADMPVDYAYYNVFKTVVAINLIRYYHNHYVNTDHIDMNFHEIISHIDDFSEFFKTFEEEHQLEVNELMIKQIFISYIKSSFSINYNRLEKKAESNPAFSAEISFLDKFLTDISIEQNVPLINKKDIILSVHNSAHLEYQEPRSGYILYNQHGNFVRKVKKSFPSVYKQLYSGVQKYRELIDAPLTSDGNNFLIYIIFSHWKNLVPELRKRYEKISTLIISDRHISHAHMLKDFLKREYPTQLDIELYTEINLSKEILEELPHELIVTNFPFPELDSKELVYIQNLPMYKDLIKVQEGVTEIIKKRNQNWKL